MKTIENLKNWIYKFRYHLSLNYMIFQHNHIYEIGFFKYFFQAIKTTNIVDAYYMAKENALFTQYILEDQLGLGRKTTTKLGSLR